MQRLTVFFSGRVQGVGFRYTSLHIARGYVVTGTVRNLPDGRVELVAEGMREEVRRYLQELTERMAANLTDVQESESSATGEFAVFSILP